MVETGCHLVPTTLSLQTLIFWSIWYMYNVMIVLCNELGDVLQVDKGRRIKKKSEKKTGIVTDKHRQHFNRYVTSYCAYAERLFFSSRPGSATLDAPSSVGSYMSDWPMCQVCWGPVSSPGSLPLFTQFILLFLLSWGTPRWPEPRMNHSSLALLHSSNYANYTSNCNRRGLVSSSHSLGRFINWLVWVPAFKGKTSQGAGRDRFINYSCSSTLLPCASTKQTDFFASPAPLAARPTLKIKASLLLHVKSIIQWLN